MILLRKQFHSLGDIPGGKLDAVVIIVDVVVEALDGNFSMGLHSCNSTVIDERVSSTGY